MPVATFFTTGDVAERFPQAMAQLAAMGHEIGCHGMTHAAFTDIDRSADGASSRSRIQRASCGDSRDVDLLSCAVSSVPELLSRSPRRRGIHPRFLPGDIQGGILREHRCWNAAATPRSGVSDLVGVAVAELVARAVSAGTARPCRPLCPSVGIRRSDPRAYSDRLPISHGKASPRLRPGRAAVVSEARGSIRHDARARRRMTAARAIPTRHAKGRRWLQLVAGASVAAGLLWLCFHSCRLASEVVTVVESARLSRG